MHNSLQGLRKKTEVVSSKLSVNKPNLSREIMQITKEEILSWGWKDFEPYYASL